MKSQFPILFCFIIFVASCVTVPKGKYYMNDIGGDVFNKVLVLNGNHQYFYVERLRLNDMISYRVYNAGVFKYKRRERKLYLTSFNKLTNGVSLSLSISFDPVLKDSIRIQFNSIDRLNVNDYVNRIPWKLFIDDEIKLWMFGLEKEFMASKSVYQIGSKNLNLELGGVMSESISLKGTAGNVFTFTFNHAMPTIDSIGNIYNSYFDQREYYLLSKYQLKDKSGKVLTRDKCKVCDTSAKFKSKFLQNLNLGNLNQDKLKWLFKQY